MVGIGHHPASEINKTTGRDERGRQPIDAFSGHVGHSSSGKVVRLHASCEYAQVGRSSMFTFIENCPLV